MKNQCVLVWGIFTPISRVGLILTRVKKDGGTGVRLASKIVLGVYLLMLVWLVLFKFSFDIPSVLHTHIRSFNFIPFADFSQENSLRETVLNFAVFIPFGLLLSLNYKRAAFWRKLAFIGLFSVALEMMQCTLLIGATDITDVITNTFGGLLGLVLFKVSSGYFDQDRLDRWTTIAIAVLLAIWCVTLGILHSRNVRYQSAPSVKTALSQPVETQPSLPKDVQFAWPASGHAAIGSVENGLLATSSVNEKLRPTASMAKVITALAVMEKQPFELGQTGLSYTITAADVASYRAYASKGGSVLPVYEGMELTQYEMLQAMLLPSANNIADMLVERVFGSVDAYTAYAQDMVHRMGLRRTVIDDASGYSPATVSTPSELVVVGIAALKNPVIAEIVAQPRAQLPGVGIVQNTNKLLGTSGVVGIKTGTTDSAGSCLLFAANYNNRENEKITIVGVIMDDSDTDSLFRDSELLLASARQGYGLTEVQPIADSVILSPSGRGSRGSKP